MIPLPPPFSGGNPLSGVGGSVGKGAATAVLDGFSGWLAAGANSLIGDALGLVTRTSPDLTAGWFAGRMTVMLEVVGLVMAPLLAAASISAIIRQDLRRLGRTWGVALPIALIVGSGAVPLTEEALHVTDALTNVLWSGAGSDVTKDLGKMGSTLVGPMVSDNAFVAAVVGLVIIVGCLLVWLELLLRAAAIYVAVAFLPLALSGLVWPATAHWAKRLVELLVALILSKFVIAAALTLAVGAIGEGKSADQVLTGGAVLLMAGFAPFLILRLVPIVEAGAIGHLQGASHRPMTAAARTATKAADAPNHPLVSLIRAGGGGNQSSLADTAVGSRGLATIGGEMDREYDARYGTGSSAAGAPSGQGGFPSLAGAASGSGAAGTARGASTRSAGAPEPPGERSQTAPIASPTGGPIAMAKEETRPDER